VFFVRTQTLEPRFRKLLFTSLGHFTNDGIGVFIPLIADILAFQRGAPTWQVTAVLVVYYLSSSLISTYVGRLADKSGRAGAMIALGIALLSTGILGFYVTLAFASSFLLPILAILSSFLTGTGSAFYHPLGASILQRAFDQNTKGKALGVNGAMGSLGRAIYPSLFFVVAVVLTKPGALAFFGLIGFLFSFIIWQGLKNESIGFATSRSKTGQKASESLTKGILALTIIAFVRSAAFQGITAYIPTYLSFQKGLAVTSALGIALTLMYASAIIGQPLFGIIVDRFDKRFVLTLSSTGSAFAILGYLFASGVTGLLLLSLFGFFTLTGFPLLLSLASDYAPKDSSSLANALVWGIGSTGGSVVGPLITGIMNLGGYAHLGFSFEVMAFAALLSGVATVFMPKPEKSGRLPMFG